MMTHPQKHVMSCACLGPSLPTGPFSSWCAWITCSWNETHTLFCVLCTSAAVLQFGNVAAIKALFSLSFHFPSLSPPQLPCAGNRTVCYARPIPYNTHQKIVDSRTVQCNTDGGGDRDVSECLFAHGILGLKHTRSTSTVYSVGVTFTSREGEPCW